MSDLKNDMMPMGMPPVMVEFEDFSHFMALDEKLKDAADKIERLQRELEGALRLLTPAKSNQCDLRQRIDELEKELNKANASITQDQGSSITVNIEGNVIEGNVYDSDGFRRVLIEALQTDLSDYATAIGENEKLRKRIEELEQQWIPVSERLPDDVSVQGQVAILLNGEYLDIGEYADNYSNGFINSRTGYSGDITHWFPLPKLPEKNDE